MNLLARDATSHCILRVFVLGSHSCLLGDTVTQHEDQPCVHFESFCNCSAEDDHPHEHELVYDALAYARLYTSTNQQCDMRASIHGHSHLVQYKKSVKRLYGTARL